MDLTEFLLARIAEDEAVARDAIGWNEGVTDWADDGEPDWIHIARHDPARVLAECDAKRRMIEAFERCSQAERTAPHPDMRNVSGAKVDSWRAALRLLALPYADHADYRDEWRP